MKDHIPLKAAARRLGVKYHRLRRWIINGRVKARQIPPGRYGRWWVSEKELQRLEEALYGGSNEGQS